MVPRDGWDHRRPASRLDPLPGARSAVPSLVRREGTERTATELPVGMPFRGDLDVCGYSSGAERESRCGNMWRVLWKHESGKYRGTEDTEIQRLLFFVFSVSPCFTRGREFFPRGAAITCGIVYTTGLSGFVPASPAVSSAPWCARCRSRARDNPAIRLLSRCFRCPERSLRDMPAPAAPAVSRPVRCTPRRTDLPRRDC
jgi:hypothetical protein